MHHIAENNGCEVFRAFISETKNKWLKEIKEALNQPLSKDTPWMTPLALCQPYLELTRLFIRYGAEPTKLSFINAFLNYL